VDASEDGGQLLVGTYEVNSTAPNDARLLIAPDSVDSGRTVPETKSPIVPLRKQHEDESLPGIRLAETNMQVASAGDWFIATRLYIAPHDLTQCLLQLPDDQRLVEVKLDGQAALIQRVDDRNWRVQLGPPTLPQSLEVVARGLHRLDPFLGSFTFARPVLKNGDVPIPVEMSLWSISSSERAAFPRASGAAPISRLEGAVLRLDRLTSIVEAAAPLAKNETDEDAANWLSPRVVELRSAQHIVQTLAAQNSNTGAAPARVQAEEDPASLAVARSTKWLAGIEGKAVTPQLGQSKLVEENFELSDDFGDDQSHDCKTVSFASESGEDQLTVDWVPGGMTAGESRMVFLAGVLCVTGIAYWLVGRNHVTT
jgi:hypothetical protein